MRLVPWKRQFRRVLNAAGHNRTFPRRLPSELGGARMLASTEGGLKYLRRDMRRVDPELTSFAVEHVKPGDVVWDVGANVGLFTFCAAGLAGRSGRVVAIEADTWLAANLLRAANSNCDRAPVSVVPAAVSDSNGLAVLHVGTRSRAVNYIGSVGSTQTDGVRYDQRVPMLTLDSLLDELPPPDVIKIDVERAEAAVVRGAARLLREHRPVMLIEVGGDAAEEIGAALRQAGYGTMIDWRTGRAVDRPTYSTLVMA